MIYRFGDFRLDLARRELRLGDAPVPLEPQVFRLLAYLLENRERVVTKDELIEAVWKGLIVSDAAISSRISAARHALGDSGEAQRIIRTLPRQGFRFVAPVEVEGDAPAAQSPESFAARQTIRFCTTAGGVRLAFATAGSGPPLIKAANWLNHLEYDWVSPVFRDLFAELCRHFLLVRYDERGTGLSDWEVGELSFEAFYDDLEAVIEAAGLERFALLGISQGAAVALAYAARHPERVTRLVLLGGYARGRRRRGTADELAKSEAFLTLMRQGWGQPNPAFRRMFASLYLPEGTAEQIDWWTDLQRVSTSAENAVRIRAAIDDIDVSALLPEVRTPTLVLHSRDEAVAPLDEARYMAARLPDARFVLLDSPNHPVLPHEPAFQRALAEITAFLAPAGPYR